MRKDKTWTVDLFDHASVLGSFSIEQGQNDVFWTNDTEAYLNFKPNSDSFEFTEAELTMYNKNDGSLVILDSTDGVNVENNVVSYEMQPEVISHFGKWTVQIRFIREDNESFTSGMLEYEVKRALGDAIPERLTAMKSWDTFFTHAQETIDLIGEAELTRVQVELDRQAQEEARETAEGERDTAEVQRKADHANRSAEFDGKADKVIYEYEPTLLSGYIGGLAGREKIRIYKDSFGFVHISGRVEGSRLFGTANPIFNVPEELRPLHVQTSAVCLNSSATPSFVTGVRINSNTGNCYFTSDPQLWTMVNVSYFAGL